MEKEFREPYEKCRVFSDMFESVDVTLYFSD